MDYYYRFFINKEEGVVVVRAFEVKDALVSEVVSKLGVSEQLITVYDLADKIGIPDSITGKAKCAPEDEFIVSYGIKIAQYRLKQKIAKHRARLYYVLSKKYAKDAENAIDFARKHIYSLDARDKYS